jgi:two-component system LytT family response regulator
LYRSGEELLAAPEISQLNLVFLDIEMDGQSGLEVKEILERSNPFTFLVFYTSHTECMGDAFGSNVISFISKPFSKPAVERCLKKCMYLKKDFYPIPVHTDMLIPCSEILYIHAENKYSIFYFTNNKTTLSRKSLRNWADELKNLGFCRISHSYIVNLKYVDKQENMSLLLTNGIILKVSRACMHNFREAYKNYRISRMRC